MFLFYWIFAYLSGSLPFGLWVTKALKGVDLREGGSRHVTTTNTIRHAGWGAGALVLILDITKGALPVYFASKAGLPMLAVAMTAAFAVIGHCYPLFAKFHGGMGLATSGGTLLALSPLAFLIALATLILLVLIIRHAARAALFTGILAPFVLWAFRLPPQLIWAATGCGVVIALRFTIDWNRQYRELWLDREKEEQKEFAGE